MKLYLYLAGAVGGLLLLIGAYFYGVHAGVDRQRSRDLGAMQKALKAVEKVDRLLQSGDLVAAKADVQRQEVTREIIREIPKIIDRPVYRNVCVDADGVRLLGRAVSAANGELAPASGPAGGAGQVQQPSDHP